MHSFHHIPLKLGRYNFIRPLGQGGMGTVYLAKDSTLERHVAIKCIEKKHLGQQLDKRLKTEARILAQLNHPNIIQLHDSLEDEHILGLVVEFVDGTSILKKANELSANQQLRVNWLIQIAEGLNSAHQAGIAHCDIKPDNILLTNDGIIKIADFGISKARIGNTSIQTQLTEHGKISGSYAYLSPEQAAGEPVDIKTDLFSFGIVMHILLTGRHPFGETNNHFTLVHSIINNNAQLDEYLDPIINKLLNKLLSKKPNKRPSANTVIEYLTRYQTSEAGNNTHDTDLTEVMPPSVSHKHTPPHRTTLSLTATILLASIYTGMQFWSKPATTYLAILEPTFTDSNQLDANTQKHLTTTVKYSLQEAALTYNQISLIPDTNSQDYDGDIEKLAKAVAADTLIAPSLQCSQLECEILLQKLQKNSEDKWVVNHQQSWQIITESKTVIRGSILNQFKHIINDIKSDSENNTSTTISEKNYILFLDIARSVSQGDGISNKMLDSLENIQKESPRFAPLYSLSKSVAINLFYETSDKQYLLRCLTLLDRADGILSNRKYVDENRFEILLTLGDISKANSLLAKLNKQGGNLVTINDLKSSLANALGDYRQSIKLDTQTIQLRPTASRFYNLAISHYSIGEMRAASGFVNRVLNLHPKHLYALNLRASIELLQGNISNAIYSYKQLLKIKTSAEALSNYGIALSLNKNYTEAISAQLKAVHLAPLNTVYLLNLADSYQLNADPITAAKYYQRIVDIEPDSDQQYSVYIQAQAHLGHYHLALQALKKARQKFPDYNDLNYSAAIAHTLAGDYHAAAIETEASINSGIDAIWFNYNWFKPLCDQLIFRELTQTHINKLCEP